MDARDVSVANSPPAAPPAAAAAAAGVHAWQHLERVASRHVIRQHHLLDTRR